MPKESRKSNSSRETPNSADKGYRVSGNNKRLDNFDQEKDLWEESKCPICLDHPHNAILLLCSSPHCRPFMCHTTDLLSNCFNEFCKSRSAAPSESGGKFEDPITCPLCRGELTGWVIVKPARETMDVLVRNCPRDWCEFSGNYAELIKHAEEEHPAGEVGENDDDEFDDGYYDEIDDGYYDEFDDLGSEEGEEDAYEVAVRHRETFLDGIHFGGPDAQTLSEEWSVSDGFVYYQRITTSGTYFFSGLAGETNIDDLRAL